MFTNITWSNYWILMMVVFGLYYFVICLIYQVAEIKVGLDKISNWFSKITDFEKKFEVVAVKINKVDNNHEKDENTTYSLIDLMTSQKDLVPIITQLLTQLKSFFETTGNVNSTKPVIIKSIHQILESYSNIRDSQFKYFINDFLILRCSRHCSLELEEADLERMWDYNEKSE